MTPFFDRGSRGSCPMALFFHGGALGVVPSLHFLIGEALGVVPRPYFLPGQALGILPKAQFWFGQAVGAVASIAFCRRKIQGQVKDHRIMIIFKTETKNKNRLHVNRTIRKQKLRLFILIWYATRYLVADINELCTSMQPPRVNKQLCGMILFWNFIQHFHKTTFPLICRQTYNLTIKIYSVLFTNSSDLIFSE